MLQFASVITTGGFLLFSSALQINTSIFLDLVNRIIDSRNLQANFIVGSLQVNYLYDAILGLIFIIAWRKQINLQYPSKLLQAMSLQWKAICHKIIWKNDLILDAPDFKQSWIKAQGNWKQYINRKQEKGNVMTKFNKKNDKNQKNQKNKKQQVQEEQIKKEQYVQNKEISKKEQQLKMQVIDFKVETNGQNEKFQRMSPRERFLLNQQNKKKSPKQSPKKQDNQQTSRIWQGNKISKKQLQNLDRSKQNQKHNNKKVSTIYLDEKGEQIKGFWDSDDEIEEKNQSKFMDRWMGKFKNIIGDKQITKEDLDNVLVDFKQKLMEKNVAQEVAIKITESVGATLLKSKTKSFTSVHKTVLQAVKEALRKILTPKKKIDLVVEVIKQREKLKPYIIVFIGVNGVGKSTNLAKVAYKLKSAKLSVMLAACDNFRAGAVQQIETHGRNLGIPVFQKGYKQQPVTIAYQAIKDATQKRIDAVLIDTAGRMQDNNSLMKQLANLVAVNKPNLVVFIGEALVGNGAVDQITKFNRILQEQSTPTFHPGIDAILLSKFDTVDDKVGTALSLVYSTSKPILYVGVGQKYPNLKELNVTTIVHSLLS